MAETKTDAFDSNTDCHFTDLASAAKALAASAAAFHTDQTCIILYDREHIPKSMMLLIRDDPAKIRRLEKFLKREERKEERKEEV